MRKIITLGLTVLTGSVLAFGSALPANAVEETNREKLCAPTALPRSLSNKTTEVTDATAVHQLALDEVAEMDQALTDATDELVSSVDNHVTALDDDGNTAATLIALNADLTAFSVAASDWLTAHIAEVGAGNDVSGLTFEESYLSKVTTTLCGA